MPRRIALVAIAVLALTACLTPEERAFRMRLAAGCPTEKACVELQREAADRNQKCQSYDQAHPPMDQKDCSPFEEDDKTATRLLQDAQSRKQQDAEDKAAAQAESAAAAEDARVAGLGDSCEALASIETAAAHATPPRDAKYRDLARTRREAKVTALSAQIDQMLQSKPDLTDLIAARAWVPKEASDVRAVLDQLRCYDGDAAAKQQSQLDAWESSMVDLIDKEQACRASPKCMADRKSAPQQKP